MISSADSWFNELVIVYKVERIWRDDEAFKKFPSYKARSVKQK